LVRSPKSVYINHPYTDVYNEAHILRQIQARSIKLALSKLSSGNRIDKFSPRSKDKTDLKHKEEKEGTANTSKHIQQSVVENNNDGNIRGD
jgi:hypothetical protein